MSGSVREFKIDICHSRSDASLHEKINQGNMIKKYYKLGL